MRLVWDDQAYFDLDEIWEYIAQDNAAAATRVFNPLKSAISLLTEHPEIGRLGRSVGTREFVYSDLPYVAVCVVHEDTIIVLRVVHTARLYPPKSHQ